MWKCITLCLCISLLTIKLCAGISSPIQTFANYKHYAKFQANVAELWWTVNDTNKEIIFELHIKSTGWIALGISPGK